MIKPEQIPDDVIIAACEEYGGGHLYDMRHAIAAAINAWPDMGTEYRSDNPRWYNGHLIILPIQDGE